LAHAAARGHNTRATNEIIAICNFRDHTDLILLPRMFVMAFAPNNRNHKIADPLLIRNFSTIHNRTRMANRHEVYFLKDKYFARHSYPMALNRCGRGYGGIKPIRNQSLVVYLAWKNISGRTLGRKRIGLLFAWNGHADSRNDGAHRPLASKRNCDRIPGRFKYLFNCLLRHLRSVSRGPDISRHSQHPHQSGGRIVFDLAGSRNCQKPIRVNPIGL